MHVVIDELYLQHFAVYHVWQRCEILLMSQILNIKFKSNIGDQSKYILHGYVPVLDTTEYLATFF